MYNIYQNFLLSISNNDVAMLEDNLNTRTDKIPMCFRKSIKTLKKLRKYVVNSLKYDYTNAMVEGKNNKININLVSDSNILQTYLPLLIYCDLHDIHQMLRNISTYQ